MIFIREQIPNSDGVQGKKTKLAQSQSHANYKEKNEVQYPAFLIHKIKETKTKSVTMSKLEKKYDCLKRVRSGSRRVSISCQPATPVTHTMTLYTE